MGCPKGNRKGYQGTWEQGKLRCPRWNEEAQRLGQETLWLKRAELSAIRERKRRKGSCPYRGGILFQSRSWAEWQRGPRTRTQSRNRVGGPQREQRCSSSHPRFGSGAVGLLQSPGSLLWPQLTTTRARLPSLRRWLSGKKKKKKNLPANAGDVGSIPGLGRSPAGGHGNSFQYSCLQNPMDRGAWQATVRGVTDSDTT